MFDKKQISDKTIKKVLVAVMLYVVGFLIWSSRKDYMAEAVQRSIERKIASEK